MRKNTDESSDSPRYYESREELIKFLRKVWHYSSEQAKCYAIVLIDEQITFRHFCIDEHGSFDELLNAVTDYVDEKRDKWRKWRTHVYFQVLPLAHRPEKGRGSAADVAVARVAFADFDFKTPLKTKDNEEGCKEKGDHEVECTYNERGKWYQVKRPPLTKFLEQVREVAEPSLIIDSGGGYHVYFLLSEEVEAEKFRKLQEKLVDRLQADPQAKDLARILRLPTTVNPRTKRVCRVIYESGKTYTFDELAQLVEQPKKRPPAEPPSEPQPLVQPKGPRLREIKEDHIKRIIELLRDAYVEGHRQDLCLYLAGWAAKSRINPVAVAKIIASLHEITGDEDPLERRLHSIMYTYPKAGISLEPYLEEIEKTTGVRPSLPSPKEQIEVKGKAGVQEVLERVIQDEEKVLSIMQELTDIFGSPSPWTGDAVFAVLDEVKKKYAVIDYSRMRMGIVQLTGDGKRLEFSPVIAEVAPTKIIIYKNPLDKSERFEIWFDGPGLKYRDSPWVITDVEGDEIARELRRKALLQAPETTFEAAFSALLVKLLNMDRVEVKVDIPRSGIFMHEGNIVVSKYELKDIEMEKLRAALELLNELAGRYNTRKFATIIKWGAAAPFTFLRKQLGYWSRWLFLHGNSATGKTTLGRIVLHLWGLKTALDRGSDKERHERLASGGNTPARIGNLLSSTTFPILLNEAEDMFTNISVVAIVKGAIDSDYARGIMDKGRYRDYLSLTSLILTSNKPFTKQLDPMVAEPLARKMIVITFSLAEKFSEEQQREFNEKIKPRLPELREIGNCILHTALREGIAFFNREITELQLGKELLAKCYELAGLQPPAWLNEEYHTSESALQELNIVELFRTRAKLEILRWYYNYYARSHPSEEKPVSERLRRAIVEGLVRGIAFIPRKFEINKDNQEVAVDGDVIITREFADLIEMGTELTSLAQELGWQYDSFYVPKRAHANTTVEKGSTMRAMKVSLKDFIDFLEMSPLTEEDLAMIEKKAAGQSSSNSQPEGSS